MSTKLNKIRLLFYNDQIFIFYSFLKSKKIIIDFYFEEKKKKEKKESSLGVLQEKKNKVFHFFWQSYKINFDLGHQLSKNRAKKS